MSGLFQYLIICPLVFLAGFIDAVAGGGGLVSGIAACVKQINPRIQVIGVQAEGANSIVASFQKDAIS